MTSWDKGLILLATLCGLFFFLFGFYLKSNSASYASVWFHGEKIGEFNIKKDTIIPVEEGIVIEIKNSRIRVLRNTCPQKICIHQGWISKSGENIFCVPNKLIVQLSDTRNRKYDALSQ